MNELDFVHRLLNGDPLLALEKAYSILQLSFQEKFTHMSRFIIAQKDT